MARTRYLMGMIVFALMMAGARIGVGRDIVLGPGDVAEVILGRRACLLIDKGLGIYAGEGMPVSCVLRAALTVTGSVETALGYQHIDVCRSVNGEPGERIGSYVVKSDGEYRLEMRGTLVPQGDGSWGVKALIGDFEQGVSGAGVRLGGSKIGRRESVALLSASARRDMGVDAARGRPTDEKGDLIVRAFPNPFNPRVTFEPFAGGVFERDSRVCVYNAKGQLVRTLEVGGAEQTRVIWDGKDKRGQDAASGVYFVSLRDRGGNARVGRCKVLLIR